MLRTFRRLSSYLNGTSADYLENLYASWHSNPNSVSSEWNTHFSSMNKPKHQETKVIGEHLKVQLLVRAFQVRGHVLASLDPLKISKVTQDIPELNPEYYGLDMDKEFELGPGVLPGYRELNPTLSLRDMVQKLKEVYCGTIGVEYMHIVDRQQCDWLRERLEVPNRVKFTLEQRRVILDRLIWSDSFERFVAAKFPSEKRFGLEGCESLIPGMKSMVDRAVENGVENVVIGMPHRGRLNVLSNVVRKNHQSIFCEFSGQAQPNVAEGSGDVKYHLGMNYDRPTPSGKRVHLSLIANPSHLEAVDPVVLGKTRALQFYGNDVLGQKSMAILLHGDAAFAGQGVVYETLGLQDLPNYTVGGTIHIIVNNQIGFTTDPRFSRSTPYCSDVAKSVGAPILHVNGDDVESVVFACQLAADWRQKFRKDVVVDIVCYRRHGHNEIDQPMFTQPKMYQRIQEQKPVLEKYSLELTKKQILTVKQIDEMKQNVWNILNVNYELSKTWEPTSKDWVSSSWHGMRSPKDLFNEVVNPKDTGCNINDLKEIGKKICSIPKDFNLHPLLSRIINQRLKSIEDGMLDWSTMEALAISKLLMERTHVRLSGQDVERGTFSQRHAVLHDQRNEQQYTPMQNLSSNQAKFTVCNSSLSEFGVLGFELGYSLVNPNSLCIWEAQFGDFANNAQCIIDQFIVSGEKKWLQRTGLVLNLPHGFDGQGPEHSSCRIERFLQLSDEDPLNLPNLSRQHQDCNIQVAYPSTPANYFHLLRRQIHRDFRKPLILVFSKSLLRHPMAKSSLKDIDEGTRFQPFIPEKKESRVVFCSGQIYYTLAKARDLNQVNVSICRLEQLCPFPFDQIKKYAENLDARFIWAQEEPINMGMWNYVEPRFKQVLQKPRREEGFSIHGQSLLDPIIYCGRSPSGAVATGKKKIHLMEEHSFISDALFGKNLNVLKLENGVPLFLN